MRFVRIFVNVEEKYRVVVVSIHNLPNIFPHNTAAQRCWIFAHKILRQRSHSAVRQSGKYFAGTTYCQRLWAENIIFSGICAIFILCDIVTLSRSVVVCDRRSILAQKFSSQRKQQRAPVRWPETLIFHIIKSSWFIIKTKEKEESCGGQRFSVARHTEKSTKLWKRCEWFCSKWAAADAICVMVNEKPTRLLLAFALKRCISLWSSEGGLVQFWEVAVCKILAEKFAWTCF